jgi:PAS domain S-box-containing protein
MVAFATLDGQPLYINRAGRRMIGLPADRDVTDLSFADIYPPDVLEMFATVAIPTGMREGTWSGEVRLKHWEGHSIPVSIVGIVHFGPDGTPSHLSAIIRDISERKRAEAALQQALAESKRLAAILEATTDYVGIADVQGTMVYINHAGRNMLGIPDDADIRQFKIVDQLASHWHEMAFNQIIPMIMEENKWQGEVELQHLDGYPISVSNVSVALHATDGSVEYLAAINRDISPQKRAELELKQAKDAADAAREAADAANTAKSTFLANMSHEIRTPMNAVIGMTSLLLNTSLDDKQRDFVETIRNSGDALLTIINDILDFSKIEAGKLDLERHPLDLRSCIESALDLLAPKAAEKGIDLAYEFGDAVLGGIVGDVTRLRQILVNLLSNAIKFTERGEVVVSVGVRDRGLGGSKQHPNPQSLTPNPYELHFSVKDTGIGIPPDKLGRLFQSFSQLDASTTREYGGTGLGLAISRRLAELMGGTMWAESRGVGQGAAFHFTIRAEAAPAPVRVH